VDETSAAAQERSNAIEPSGGGGLAGRIAALSGIDPDNPDRPVPPPGGLLKLLLELAN